MAKEELEEFSYRSIIGLILENKYRPGDFLLETEISEKLNISRTPVRSALSRLTAEGFLEKRKKRGCYIPVPNTEEAVHVFSARQLIEGKTAALAAVNASGGDIVQMQNILDEEKEYYRSGKHEKLPTVNAKLHTKIAEASRNIYLEKYCKNILWRSGIYILFFTGIFSNRDKTADHDISLEQHNEIFKAISEGKSDKARKIMHRHVQDTYERLFKKQ